MKGKFKSISKILPILLLVVFVGIAVLTPVHQAEAAAPTGIDENSFWWNPVDYIYRWATTDAKETVYEYSANIAIGLIHFVASSALKLLDWLVHWAAWAVNIFLDPDIYMEVLKSPAIDIGWTICRDLCNLFFVLILLAISFATIFRIQAYSAKALLPKFILAIFLINFSRVIATIVIDFGQILMFQFVTWMGNFGPIGGGDDGAMSCLTAVSRQFVRDYPVDFTPSMEKMMGALFAAIFVFVLMFIYLIFAAFLLIRLIVLGLLIVLSPFAFMSVILPGTRSHSSKWWGSLFKYVLFGPIFVFFIYLSSEMGQHLMGAPGTVLEATDYAISPPDQITKVGEGGNENIFKVLVYFIKGGIVMGMLLASVFMTKSMGIIGAGALIGGTAGIGLMAGKAYRGARYAKGKAVGAAKGGTGYAHGIGKAHVKGYRAAGDWVGKQARKIPVARGRYLEKQSGAKQENKEIVVKYEKTLEPMRDEDRKTYIKDLAVDPRKQAAARQAHLNLLAKDRGENLSDERLDKKVGYGNIDALRKDVESVERQGGDTREIKKYRPDLITDDTKRREKILETIDKDEEKKIHPDALKNKDDHKLFKDKLGDKRYKSWLESQSETRKDGISDHYKTTELRDPATGNVDLDVSKLVTAFDKGSSDITKSIKESFQNFDPATSTPVDFTPGDANEGAYKAFISELKSLGELNAEQLKEAVAYTNRQQLASSTRTTNGAQKEVIYKELGRLNGAGMTPDAEQAAAWDYVQTNASWRRS